MAVADVRLDPHGDDLPQGRMIELRSQRIVGRSTRTSAQLKETTEPRRVQSAELARASPRQEGTMRESSHPAKLGNPSTTQFDEPSTASPDARATDDESSDMRLTESTNDGPSLREYIEETEGFLKDVRLGYPVDKTLSKVLDKPSEHAAFALRDGLIYSKNHGGDEVLCIPRAIMWNLSNHEGQQPIAAWTVAQSTDPKKTMGIDRHGLRGTIPGIQGLRLPLGSVMPTDVDGTPGTDPNDH
ncbi:hypothetical protein BJ138DRAFT_1119893 [Hygrophoropsis aurantiaca]|uniref:Uncharacterized protein n=1 Tax=Hygrophoropsis aurantiaca TaxID=72124 RepID=A0ACB7ZTB5_9AGAM|nr:hypothetical protein BJ138DRAFT_1119893 [Hygrophoropsis aurantiaca]